MTSPIARSLHRFIDAVQRSLFDDGAAAVPAGASPNDADVLRHPQASRGIVLDGIAVRYALRRSRRRTIGFSVGPDGLSVSAPRWVPLRDVDAALCERSRWIVAKLAEQRERAARLEAARVVWQDGATIEFLGEPLRIVLAGCGEAAGDAADPGEARRRSASKASCRLDCGVEGSGPRLLHVGVPLDAASERVRDAVHGWLRREATRVFALRVDHFASRLEVRVRGVALSSARTRWGSASSNGTIRLHWRLVQQSMATIDYVVAHELAHLREMNHGEGFWALVRSVVPDVESARQALKDVAAARID